MPIPDSGPVYEFFNFRLDCGRFELLRGTHPVRMERKPMELLILLASREGKLVTRGEIAQRLWSSEVFVDTEHGINTAIRKVRAVLRDDPENPRYVQTVTGMGYRFIAPATKVEGETKEPDIGAPNIPERAMTHPAEVPWRSSNLRHGDRMVLAAGAVLAVAVSAILIGRHTLAARREASAPITSIAVLPLVNFSGDPKQEYFADGMTDELITMLARDSTLRVTSRTSVMQYKGTSRPLPEIAGALHVNGILEGSVSQSQNQVHMTLQLIRADTDTHVWAQSYDRDAADVVDLPGQAAQAIATRLKSSVVSLPAPRHINPEAHEAYLQGRYFWFGDNYPQCTALMQKAIELQPDYALAWSGLADCYGAATATGLAPAQDGFQKVLADAGRALQLNPNLAEAHHSMAAYYLFYAWDWPRAEAESRRAIELNPNNAEFHHLYSYILRAEGRNQEQLEEQKRATELDPFSRPWALGTAYISLREYDAAISELRTRAESHSQNFWLCMELARAYWLKGMIREWVAELREGYLVTGDYASANAIQQAFAFGGEQAVARWQLNRDLKQAHTQYLSPMNLAFDYAYAGQKEKTVHALQDAFRTHASWLVFIRSSPEFDSLHGDPRYQTIVQHIGFPAAED